MNKTRILFVCLGNICRSPAAEIVMRQLVVDNNLEDKIELDSAGLLDYHEGEMADIRMRQHVRERGYDRTHRSRPIRRADFKYFDLIVCMDDENLRELQRLASGDEKQKLHKLTAFCRDGAHDHVPDPYYGGAEGFELVLDIVEDACKGLLEHINKTIVIQ